MKTLIKWLGAIIVALLAVIGAAFVAVFFAMQYGLLNVRGSIAERNAFFPGAMAARTQSCADAQYSVCEWDKTPEWQVVKGGLEKDATIIAGVSAKTGVDGRMIVAVVVPEQIRFFTANREVFKRYFEPLKILGSLSQFSLGVSGIKEDTAKSIEQYAADPASPFYPGAGYADLLAYASTTADHDEELYARLTDAKDHYYSLLYTAMFIKEIESQWQRAGFDISKNPEAVTTLFNIGFAASKPNANPKAAGAPIDSGGHTYMYGELGSLFYNSTELINIFPK